MDVIKLNDGVFLFKLQLITRFKVRINEAVLKEIEYFVLCKDKIKDENN